MPGSRQELPTPEIGVYNSILWFRCLQTFALPENRPGGWVGERDLSLMLINPSVLEWEDPGGIFAAFFGDHSGRSLDAKGKLCSHDVA